MTQEQFNKAKEIAEKRDYYKELVNKLDYSIWNKNRLDKLAKRDLEYYSNDSNAKWTLQSFFRVRLFYKDNTPKIGIRPHWHLSTEDIQIEADPELISLIFEWLEKKVKEYDEQIEKI